MDQVIIDNSINNIDDLFVWYPGCKTFFFEPGTYYVTQQFNINTNGVRLIGATQNPNDVHIIQQTLNSNGLNIIADNVTVEYISVHVEQGEV